MESSTRSREGKERRGTTASRSRRGQNRHAVAFIIAEGPVQAPDPRFLQCKGPMRLPVALIVLTVACHSVSYSLPLYGANSALTSGGAGIPADLQRRPTARVSAASTSRTCRRGRRRVPGSCTASCPGRRRPVKSSVSGVRGHTTARSRPLMRSTSASGCCHPRGRERFLRNLQ